MINLYTNSTIGSYTTGTVSCTNNSDIVIGTGTTWSEIVNPGDILTLNDDKLYVIKTVNSNTSITLDKVFAENTVSNSAYRIFLNTAAHFPSDTAAKVERALEQLSDINEAAINNDRTVTAATKLEGKGLTSTAGTINLNPSSVNGNTGGQINFHYNQSANTTSSIVENASGQIRVNGNLSLSGDIINPTTQGLYIRKASQGTEIRPITTYTGNTRYDSIIDYRNTVDNKTLSMIYTPVSLSSSSNWRNAIHLLAYDLTKENEWSSICIGYTQNGVYTSAPTPATNDNSWQIATTAFVNNAAVMKKAAYDGSAVKHPTNVANGGISCRVCNGIISVYMYLLIAGIDDTTGWKNYTIVTNLTPKPLVGGRFTLTDQSTGLSVSALYDTSGNIQIEQKGINMCSKWVWGGFTTVVNG